MVSRPGRQVSVRGGHEKYAVGKYLVFFRRSNLGITATEILHQSLTLWGMFEPDRPRRLDDDDVQIACCGQEGVLSRAPIGDGGGFDAYCNKFPSAQIWADLYFTGSYVSEDDIPAAIKHMQFNHMNDGGRSRP